MLFLEVPDNGMGCHQIEEYFSTMWPNKYHALPIKNIKNKKNHDLFYFVASGKCVADISTKKEQQTLGWRIKQISTSMNQPL